MKIKIYLFLPFVFLLGFFSANSLTNTGFSVTGGIAVPNSEVNNIFNSNIIQTADTNISTLSVMRPDMKMGYSIIAQLSFTLSDDAYFFGGFGLTRFGEGQFALSNPTTHADEGYLLTKTSIYSLKAGINYYFLENFIGVYGIGNLSYNFIANSVNPDYSKVSLKLPYNPTDSRLGFTLGLGFELPLKQVAIILETKYCELNYIGKTNSEQPKSMYLIQAGFRF